MRLFAGAVFAFCVSGTLARLVFWVLKRSGAFRRRLLVVGAGTRAWNLVALLQEEGTNPHYDVTFAHDPTFGDLDSRLAEAHGARIVTVQNGEVLELAPPVPAG